MAVRVLEETSLASALARPVHQQQCGFNASPSLRLFLVAGLLARRSLLRGLSDRPGAVRFQKLPRVVLDFSCIHGVILQVREKARAYER